MNFSPVSDILSDIQNGHFVIMMDHADRENEGDLILAAQHVTAEKINFLLKEARGLICLALTPEKAQLLGLSALTSRSGGLHQAAFTAPIDSKKVKTGVSARERAITMQEAASPNTTADEFSSPGHVFPIIARHGGVLERAGHTEAAVDLACEAGCWPSGITCEILDADGEAAGPAYIAAFSEKWKIKVGRIEDLILYRQQRVVNELA